MNDDLSTDLASVVATQSEIAGVPGLDFSDDALARASSHHAGFLTDLVAMSRAMARRDGYDQVSRRTVDEAATHLQRGKSGSEWLKWVGFFSLGIAATLLLEVIHAPADKMQKEDVYWLVGFVVVALVCLLPALMIDQPVRKPFKRK